MDQESFKRNGGKYDQSTLYAWMKFSQLCKIVYVKGHSSIALKADVNFYLLKEKSEEVTVSETDIFDNGLFLCKPR